jgi:SAM-dependent methyltransferase
MGLDRTEIVCAIAARIGAKSYLEIGVDSGATFLKVDVPDKTGVDPNPNTPATHHETSFSFFANTSPERKWDLVFVDGLHHQESVLFDIMSARRHLAPGGVIVVHDVDPPTLEAGSRTACAGAWCGDVWLTWLRLRRSRIRHWMAVVDADLGIGVIAPGRSLSDESAAIPELSSWEPSEAWAQFRANRRAWLGLIAESEFEGLLSKLA